MRRFRLHRSEDQTGVSGTGVVAEGVVFGDGRTVLRWCVPGRPSSIVVWDDLSFVLEIHGHDGRTDYEWLDSE